VNEYLDALPLKVRILLKRVHLAIKATAPKAGEVISYWVPTYRYYELFVHFIACKNHLSFITVSKSITKVLLDFRERAYYSLSKGIVVYPCI
jgi:uncharacterized protein YdhG (YjbR/CyaY superfamily)